MLALKNIVKTAMVFGAVASSGSVQANSAPDLAITNVNVKGDCFINRVELLPSEYGYKVLVKGEGLPLILDGFGYGSQNRIQCELSLDLVSNERTQLVGVTSKLGYHYRMNESSRSRLTSLSRLNAEGLNRDSVFLTGNDFEGEWGTGYRKVASESFLPEGLPPVCGNPAAAKMGYVASLSNGNFNGGDSNSMAIFFPQVEFQGEKWTELGSLVLANCPEKEELPPVLEEAAPEADELLEDSAPLRE